MGIYDEYIPVPEINCPDCGTPIGIWQGKDGPCALLLWKQGELSPIDQPIDEEVRLDDEKIALFRLPKTFIIYGGDCQCSSKYAALCKTENSFWVKTTIISSEEARDIYDKKF